MEPLDDKELSQLLHEWTAPPAPASLGRRVLSPRGSWWWWWWLTGTIRIPVPVGRCAGGAVVLLRRTHSPCRHAARAVGVAGGFPTGVAT